MLDQDLLARLATLIALPLEDRDYLTAGAVVNLRPPPRREGSTRIPTLVQDPWCRLAAARAPAFLGRDDRRPLLESWLQAVRDRPLPGFSLELAESWFNRVWCQSRAVDMFSFYQTLANAFLTSGADRLHLDPSPELLPAFGLTRLDAFQLYQLLAAGMGSDLLPAMAAIGIPDPVRRSLVERGLPVDPVSSRHLQQLLDQGLADLHVHAGSAFRCEHLWPTVLEEIEQDADRMVAGHGAGSGHWTPQSPVDLPLFLIAAILRRWLGLYLSGVADRDYSLWRYVVEGIQAVHADRWRWESTAATSLLLEAERLAIRSISLGLASISESELMVGSMARFRQNRDRGLRLAEERLWWIYVRIKAHFLRQFVQEPGLEGLGSFRESYEQSRRLQGLSRSVLCNAEPLQRHLDPFGRLCHLEARASPDVPEMAARLACAVRLAAGQTGAVNNSHEPPRLTFVAHFVKFAPIGEYRDLPGCMRFLRDQANGLQALLVANRRNGWYRHFAGIDVAGPELLRPNWFYLPLFVEMRPWWRRRFPDPPLGYTFHAGEDFVHLSQGLRHIGEILEFFPWEDGDRIGHGLALGLDASHWQRRHPEVGGRIDDQLFDLLFEWGLYVHRDLAYEHRRLRKLEQAIDRLGGRLLEHLGWRGRLSPETWYRFYRGIFCPELVARLLHRPVRWRGAWGYRLGACMDTERDAQAVRALRLYLDGYNRRPMIEDRYPLRDTNDTRRQEVERLAAIQEWLVGRLAERHIAIEACPKGNLNIRGIPSMVEHPLLRLQDRIPIVIGTDNPLTFATDLSQELAGLYLAELEQGRDAAAALGRIEKMVRAGKRFLFKSTAGTGDRCDFFAGNRQG